MKKKNAFLIFSFGTLVVFAMTALGIDRVKITRVCRDQRLYMDGSYFATVESGGLSAHSTVLLYKQVNLKRIKLGEESVTFERSNIGSVQGDLYQAANLKLFVPDISKSSPLPTGSLEASLPTEKIDAKLLCAAK